MPTKSLGPYFFNEKDDSTATVNSDWYKSQVIRSFWLTLSGIRPIAEHTKWFQQDGATPYTSASVLELLEEKFADRVISHKTEDIWAPYSPDLSPPDFFLWGYLIDKVYMNLPANLDNLKAEIHREVCAIPRETCERGSEYFVRKIKLCRDRQCYLLEHVLRHRHQNELSYIVEHFAICTCYFIHLLLSFVAIY